MAKKRAKRGSTKKKTTSKSKTPSRKKKTTKPRKKTPSRKVQQKKNEEKGKDIWVVEEGKLDEFHTHQDHVRRLEALHERHRPHPRFFLIMFCVVVVILGIPLLYLSALADINLNDIEITEFTVINSTAFHIQGNVVVDNPRSIPLKYDGIDYFIFLGSEKVLLAEGYFEGAKLPKKSVTKVPFEKTMYVSPTFETVMGLIEDNDDILLIKGTVHLPLSGFSFEKRMPVRESLKVYLTMKLDDMLSDLDSTELPEVLLRLEGNLREKLAQL